MTPTLKIPTKTDNLNLIPAWVYGSQERFELPFECKEARGRSIHVGILSFSKVTAVKAVKTTLYAWLSMFLKNFGINMHSPKACG